MLEDQIILPTNFPRPAFKFNIVYFLSLAPDPLSVPTSMPGSQSELSQLISNDCLSSIKGCEGNKDYTSQEEDMLPTDSMKSNLCIHRFTDKNLQIETGFFTAEPFLQ